MAKRKPEIVPCPVCENKTGVGFLGGNVCRRYFCKRCCTEYSMRKGVLKIYDFDEHGNSYDFCVTPLGVTI